MECGKPIRIVLYSHDAVGLGHLRRNLALSYSLSLGLHAPVTGLLISGNHHAGRLSRPDNWDLLILPGYEKFGGDYRARQLVMSLAELAALRAKIIVSALEMFKPDILIVDKHPAGLQGELLPALQALTTTRLVLGLRDILDAPDIALAQWYASGSHQAVRKYYHRIWIYSDPRIHSPFDSGELPAELRTISDFTGYLAKGRRTLSEPDAATKSQWRRQFLTFVGAGSDGFPVAQAAVRARVPAGYQHIVCTGPDMAAADVETLRQMVSSPAVSVTSFIEHAATRIAYAAGLLTMGGYNTLCEALATDTPTLVVPRRSPRLEQQIRAQMLADCGLIDMCLIDQISPAFVSDWLARCGDRRVTRRRIDLDGLQHVAALAGSLLTTKEGIDNATNIAHRICAENLSQAV
ncbi:hypothetical protein AXX16_0316 [Serratia rubidaea]|uniref:glycosyltransferase family protein n=1 Tax=Serratia rubidaea TaxID=61652 RepID=UPI00078AFBEA|nr:glycosyltransferase [Serratia rubidaea]AML56061.1 hypothetical protein AXX16_0316 [Serratia rubidaea]